MSDGSRLRWLLTCRLAVSGCLLSAQDALDNFTMHICQAELAALKSVRQPFMINSQQVHQRCLKIVDVDSIGCDVESQFV